jgi:hypothetical protein
MPEIKMRKVVSKCKFCKKVSEFHIPNRVLEQRRQGVHLDDPKLGLTREQVVQLSQHVCPECQKKGKEDGASA